MKTVCKYMLAAAFTAALLLDIASAQYPAAPESSAPATPFWDLYTNYTASSHVQISADGLSGSVILDNVSAGAFGSYSSYSYGFYSMQLKLHSGYSAGTVAAYYMSSGVTSPDYHDEFDFEFLGNVTGQPWLLQTNIFVDGIGNREIRHNLWFDPTVDYHIYSVLWNSWMVVFYVDTVPIRVFPNFEAKGIPFPSKALNIWGSYWDGSGWATEGGKIPCDFSKGPFITEIRGFGAQDACQPVDGDVSACQDPSYPAWWNAPQYQSLSNDTISLIEFMNQYFMDYNYCTDYKRFPNGIPPECNLLPYSS